MKKTFAGLIPPNSQTVLEVIGEDLDYTDSFEIKGSFLHINPDCDYLVKNVEEVFNSSEMSKITSDKVDVIVFSETAFTAMSVKRLVATIKEAAKYLKSDGMIIFTIANLSYAGNITALLNGEPPTVKTTLTFEDLQTAITNADMDIIKDFRIARETTVKRALVEIAKTELNVTHHIACTMKKSAAETLKTTIIQSYLGEVLVCAEVRVNAPNRFMASSPGVYMTTNKSGEQFILPNDKPYDKKIFINQRVSVDTTEMGISMFNKMVAQNYLLIEEMDDNPILWRKKYEDTNFINFIGVHGIQTSTKPLAELFRQFNPNVKVFENQLSELPPHRDFKAEIASHQPTVIFFGALNRDRDFYELLPAINKIAAEYGDNILFKVIAKTALFETIETPNKVFIGKKEIYDGQYVPYNIYEQELRSSHISLLPLKDNIFNRSKSDLKFIECAGNGSVVLASPTVYSNTVKDGETGFIYHDVNEFYNKLKLLINNSQKRCEVAEKAYDYVKHNRLLSQHYEERWDWYNELIARLPELNAETQKRIEILKDKGYEAFGGFGDIQEKVEVF